MASFFNKVKAALSIGNANSWSNPNAKNKPQPKPQPKVNVAQLQRAMQGPGLQSYQNVARPAPRPQPAPPAQGHQNIFNRDFSEGFKNLVVGTAQQTGQGLVKLSQLTPHAPQVYQPKGRVAQDILGKAPIISPQKQFAADKAKHGTLAAAALFPIGLALDTPATPGKKQAAEVVSNAAKGVKFGKNEAKSVKIGTKAETTPLAQITKKGVTPDSVAPAKQSSLQQKGLPQGAAKALAKNNQTGTLSNNNINFGDLVQESRLHEGKNAPLVKADEGSFALPKK
jgi:hypothetical protein